MDLVLQSELQMSVEFAVVTCTVGPLKWNSSWLNTIICSSNIQWINSDNEKFNFSLIVK